LFGSKVFMYPNIFKYMGHIKRTDGFLGLYRGLGPRLLSGIIGNYTTNAVQASLTGKPIVGGQPDDDELSVAEQLPAGPPTVKDELVKLVTDTTYETISRCAGIVISHPIHVIFVRTAAQFIGRETKYSALWSSIGEIWENEGILGFFSGLIPRLVGEVLTIWMANALAHCITTYLLGTQSQTMAKDMKGYAIMVSQLLVTQVTYPFNVVSTVMCVNGSGLAAARPPISPVYTDWLDCWSRLTAEDQIKRGSSIFWRTYRGPVTYGRDGVSRAVVTKM